MTQSVAIHIHRHGDAEVLSDTVVEVPPPAAGELQIRQSAIGLNFADIYQRRGSQGPHAATPFPITLGAQGAGVVEAIGAGVTGFARGQAVAYVHAGAYQVTRNLPAHRVVPLPDTVSQELAGATLLRGLTAEYLLRRLHVVRPGQTVLVHAAAGGMGVILSQWARALGATVIGTVGSPEKANGGVGPRRSGQRILFHLANPGRPLIARSADEQVVGRAAVVYYVVSRERTL